MEKIELEKRISELEKLVSQQEKLIETLQFLLNQNQQYNTYLVIQNLCSKGGDHDYISPWFSITPPPCKKCGELGKMVEITYDNNTVNPPWDFNKHGGNVMTDSPNYQFKENI